MRRFVRSRYPAVPPRARRAARRGIVVAGTALALASAACADPYIPPVFAAIELESGNLQTGKVCTPLSEPLVVSAHNQFGDLLPGARIVFTAESGSFAPAIPMTGADGRVRVTYTLGSTPGPVSVTALGWQGEMSLEFSFTAEPDPPATLRRISGHNQSAPAGEPLLSPLVVRVANACGAGVPDVTVAWVIGGDGQLGASTSTTNADGYANNTLTLPPDPQVLVVTASAEGFAPVNFTATAQ